LGDCIIDESLITKRIRFNFSRVSLNFDVNESLFSSYDIDVGTKALLNSLRKNKTIDYSKILDLGCGYGPLGLFLKAQDPNRVVHLIDRDSFAVEVACHNAKLNCLDVVIYPSLDYEEVKDKFSLIITNFPAKMEKKGLQTFVYGASSKLIFGGVLALVVVKELSQSLELILNNESINILYREYKKGYSLFHVSFKKLIDPPIQKYERDEMTVSLSRKYYLKTSFGLPEFDKLGFGTLALYSLLKMIKDKRYKSILLLDPGQGHGAIGAIDYIKPSEVLLSSRDLLQLKTADENIKHNFRVEPSITLQPYLKTSPNQELIIWNVQRKNDFALHSLNLETLQTSPGTVIIYGERSIVQKLAKKMKILEQTDHGNYCAIFFSKDKL
jgi:methylase of polypeptide subunit release factors